MTDHPSDQHRDHAVDEHAVDEHLRAQTRAERERLTELLSALAPEQWATASLCTGWRVREVVAHLTMPYRLSGPRFLLGLLRHGFRFNAFSDAQARRDTARLDDAALLRSLRDNVGTTWKPPGPNPAAGALSHDVIHGLDVTRPLGLPDAPAERVALVLGNAAEKNLSYFGTDLGGVTLVATDADVRIGSGSREVAVPVADVLLVVTGRIPVP